MYTTAGLALENDYNLNKCFLILISNAIKIGNRNIQEETEKFVRQKKVNGLQKYRRKHYSHWKRDYKKSVPLPIVEDIKKMNMYHMN